MPSLFTAPVLMLEFYKQVEKLPKNDVFLSEIEVFKI